MKKGIALLLSFFIAFTLLAPLSVQAAETLILHRSVPAYPDSLSAAAGTNPTRLYEAGTYYVYKRATNGMVNVSKAATSPGGWIDPADNVAETPAQPDPTPAPVEKVLRQTTATALNFRTGPSTSYSVIRRLSYGTIVEILAQVDATWYRIRHNGTTGYVSGKYLTSVDAAQPAPPVESTGTVHVTISSVNFRTGPSTSYPVIVKLAGGVQVEKLGDYNASWSKIRYNGTVGAISTRYLRSVSGSTEPAPAPAPSSTTPYLTTASVNFRSGPSTNYSSYGILPKGTEVSRITTSGSWSKVIYLGRTGYIHSNYLTVKPVPGPRIGIAWYETFSNSVTYTAEAITKAGGTVVYLPRVTDEASAQAALKQVKAVIFTGGGDVDPKFYGETLLPGQSAADLDKIHTGRDASDLALMKAAIAADVPTLGICRGFQVMNVAAGGTLIQDIPLEVADPLIHRDPARKVLVYHNVIVKSGTKLGQIIGSGNQLVNSWHHQGIQDLGSGFIVTASSSDGLIEAIEMPDKKYMIGLQFHPESHVRLNSNKFLSVFTALVDAAR